MDSCAQLGLPCQGIRAAQRPVVQARVQGRALACLTLVLALLAGTPHALSEPTNSIGMDFVCLPAGSFLLEPQVPRSAQKASQSTEESRTKMVISRPFCLGIYPVTQAQWETVMGSNPSWFKGPSRPVENVSWNDAQDFIRRLNAREGTQKYRLPTEMEWEYAARGGTQGRYFFLDRVHSWEDAELALCDYAWFNKNAGGTTQPVGQKKPNPYGLYDIYGNVWEWVQDRFAPLLPSGPEFVDYTGPPPSPVNNRERVFRGGSFGLSSVYSRSGSRRSLQPDYKHNDIGFRVAFTLQ